LLIQNSPLQDPTIGLCLGPCGGPREVGVSYERGTPAPRRARAVQAPTESPLYSGAITALFRAKVDRSVPRTQDVNLRIVRYLGERGQCRRPRNHTPAAHLRPASVLITQKVFLKSFFKSQLPYKSVNLSFIITNINNKLTDLCGN